MHCDPTGGVHYHVPTLTHTLAGVGGERNTVNSFSQLCFVGEAV